MVLAVIAWGIGLALLLGGRMSALREVRLRYEIWIAVVFVLQGLVRGRFVDNASVGEVSVLIWVALSVALLFLLYSNGQLLGCWLMMLGVALNGLVVVANLGMPYLHTHYPKLAESEFYMPLEQAVILGHLGDILPGPGSMLLSLGDVLLFVGVSVSLVRVMTVQSDEGMSLQT